MVDGTPLDEPVFVRGNPRFAGETAHRGLLEKLSTLKADPKSSGRLLLARWLASSEHPLTSRVMVNRVWSHLFGRGLVASPDDFGHMGQPPSHPDLLDWLSDWFVHEADWSVKSLVKLLVTSRTYQMAALSQDSSQADVVDPDNRLFHKMRIKRLEGEILRDAVLKLSGSLKRSMGGEPIPVHLTRFMEGRGRPGESGPLDGDGRRSVYLEVRRNFLNPEMLAFDTPVPSTTAGKRSISNVPAQSLILMNDPFIIEQAKKWSESLIQSDFEGDREKIDYLFRSALGRRPTENEQKLCLSFLGDREVVKDGEESARARAGVWSDLCHAVLNMKEFYYVN